MDSTTDVKPGQLVMSRAGRDKGRKFIVIEVENKEFVKVVDGDLRKIEKPKRKKIKHLVKTSYFSEFICNKLVNQDKITNVMIRNELEKLSVT